MALHDDLLVQAEHLATKEPRRPKQASLRRAVSAAYYALFHLLVDDTVRFIVAGGREPLRRQLARSFEHGLMKEAARAFAMATKNPPKNAWRLLLATPPSPALCDVADTFVDVQQERHAADYDLGRVFVRSAAKATVARVSDGFSRWKAVRGTPEGEAFMLALLVRSRP